MKEITFDEFAAAKPGDVVGLFHEEGWLNVVFVVRETAPLFRHRWFARTLLKIADSMGRARYYKFSGVEKIKYEDIHTEGGRRICVGVAINSRDTAFKIISLEQARRETQQLWWVKEDVEQ